MRRQRYFHMFFFCTKLIVFPLVQKATEDIGYMKILELEPEALLPVSAVSPNSGLLSVLPFLDRSVNRCL